MADEILDEKKAPESEETAPAEKPKTGPAKFMVKTEFRDAKDFSVVHPVGKNVSHFGKDRLAKLVKNGHVEKV